MNTQLKKGVLELCVLSMLGERDMYGYELVAEISKDIEIAEGTIYPLLKRLKEEGFVSSYLVESQEGPPRKYYKLTQIGITTRKQLVSDWFDFLDGIGKIIRRSDSDGER